MDIQQAKKINNHKGRTRAVDFEPWVTALINEACVFYRCMISTEDAFPSNLTELGFAQRAWTDACRAGALTVEPNGEAFKVIMRRGSQMRGEAKTKIRNLIASEYGFHPSQSSKTREHNLKRAAALKDDLNFTYRPNGAVTERKGLYQALIIQKAVNAVWFAHRCDEGVLFPTYFHPFPLPAIALVLTAVECGIDEWISGSREDIDFKSSDYETTYRNHLEMLKILEDETKAYEIVGKMQIKLHQNGR
ncbi:hypothetical protein BC826DRAFT_907102 [Russula brevipes]|nr:hypothetical protein BC826DRAFT_907102 [Russula brevipes]